MEHMMISQALCSDQRTDMLRLDCETKQYDWGQPGGVSLVADLSAHGSGAVVQEDAPYAELWMGVHASGPSRLRGSGETLGGWLSKRPQALGNGVLANFGSELPFLFKVLSVQKALSIQSHPDKVLARQLHAQRPDVYKDPNHKPELALAVRDFEALCGFCTLGEISKQLWDKPELRQCVGNARARAVTTAIGGAEATQRTALRGAFTALMTCDAACCAAASQQLHGRLRATDAACLSEKDELFLRVYEQYPGDVGTLSVFFLNHLRLAPGEAVYLAANEPHAYLSGELIEAMASSDNVIRAGLTPKLRDTGVLCSSLTYKQGPPRTLKGQPVSRGICLYKPPFEEFQVLRVNVDQPGTISIPAQQSPMILLGLESSGTHSLQSFDSPVEDSALESLVTVGRGTVLFVPAGTPLELHSVADVTSGACTLLAYAATANDNMFVSALEAARRMYRSMSDLGAVKTRVNYPEECAMMGSTC